MGDENIKVIFRYPNKRYVYTFAIPKEMLKHVEEDFLKKFIKYPYVFSATYYDPKTGDDKE